MLSVSLWCFPMAPRSEESFKQYFSEMPWVAVPYSDEARRSRLNRLYGIQGKILQLHHSSWRWESLPWPSCYVAAWKLTAACAEKSDDRKHGTLWSLRNAGPGKPRPLPPCTHDSSRFVRFFNNQEWCSRGLACSLLLASPVKNVKNFSLPRSGLSGPNDENKRECENKVTDFRAALPFCDWSNSPPPLRHPNTDPAGRGRVHDHATGPCGSAERPRVPALPMAPEACAGAQRVQRRTAPRRALPRPVRGWVGHDQSQQVMGSAKYISLNLVQPAYLQMKPGQKSYCE